MADTKGSGAIDRQLSGLLGAVKRRPQDAAQLTDEQRDGLRESIAAVVRAVVADVAAVPEASARAVMSDAERAEIAAAFKQRHAQFLEDAAAAKRRTVAAELAFQAARRALAHAHASESEIPYVWTSRRDPLMARAWAERLHCVDELIAEAVTEAADLKADAAELPADAREFAASRAEIVDDIRSATDALVGRRYTNAASVEARRTALRRIAVDIREWTTSYAYTTEGELRAMVAQAREALPRVANIREILAQDPRGQRYLRAVSPRPASAA